MQASVFDYLAIKATGYPHVLLVIDHHRKHHPTVIAKLPMWFTVLVPVCHEQRVIHMLQTVNSDPGNKGECTEVPVKACADAGAGTIKLKSL